MQYRGFDVSRSLDGSYWFAIPSRDMTTENKLKAATAAGLKMLIDDACTATPNPWELPMNRAAAA
jgi:hypothetical protein